MDKCVYNDVKLENVRELVRGSLSAKRYAHSVGVEQQCLFFANLYGMNENDSMRMRALGMLHDFTKELSLSEQVCLCHRYNIVLNFEAGRYEKVLHGMTAAALLADRYPDFVDEEMCRAICSHTVGNECMSLPDRILYLSDYVEPSRTYADCVELRNIFNSALARIGFPDVKPSVDDLDTIVLETMITSFDMTIKDLICDGKAIFPDTVSTRNALIEERMNKSC